MRVKSSNNTFIYNMKSAIYGVVMYLAFFGEIVGEENRTYEEIVETQLFGVLLVWYHMSEPDVQDKVAMDCARISFIYYIQKVVKDNDPNLISEKYIRAFISKLTDSQRKDFEDPFRWKQKSILRFVSPFEMDFEEYEKNISRYLSYFVTIHHHRPRA